MQDDQKQSTTEPATNWQFTPETNEKEQSNPSSQPVTSSVSWTASEYIAHEKNQSWYPLVGLSVAAIAIVVYFIDPEKSWLAPLMIVMAGGVFIASAARKPKVLNYTVDTNGVHISNKSYAFSDFKSFSIIEEGAIDSIMLTPLQRFMPSLTIYFEPKDEEKIVSVLGNYLPYEDRQQDPIDKFMRKIRF